MIASNALLTTISLFVYGSFAFEKDFKVDLLERTNLPAVGKLCLFECPTGYTYVEMLGKPWTNGCWELNELFTFDQSASNDLNPEKANNQKAQFCRVSY
jgi:hypothetical protein